MVGLNPSKFYGRLLPRPRIYCDVKFSDARVDPPASVNAALLEWAGDASWKMGGTAAKRKRMSGKIEGRMSKLRAMEESDEEEEAVPLVEQQQQQKKKKALGFGKNLEGESPASVLPGKHVTPIERMLETPWTKRGKLAPRRIISSSDDVAKAVQPRARRSRKEQVLEESEDDSSDDDAEAFLQTVEENKLTPTRSVRKSARLQGSPTASQTPDSKSKRMKKTPTFLAPSPASQKRKREVAEENSGSDSDSGSEESDSVYL